MHSAWRNTWLCGLILAPVFLTTLAQAQPAAPPDVIAEAEAIVDPPLVDVAIDIPELTLDEPASTSPALTITLTPRQNLGPAVAEVVLAGSVTARSTEGFVEIDRGTPYFENIEVNVRFRRPIGPLEAGRPISFELPIMVHDSGVGYIAASVGPDASNDDHAFLEAVSKGFERSGFA